MQTTWNLKKFFYTSIHDPQIKKDVEAMKHAFVAFEKKYIKNDSYLKSPAGLKSALLESEKLAKVVASAKPLMYLSYMKELDSSNTEIEALLNKYSLEMTAYENRVLFFDIRLGKIPLTMQKKMLASKELAPWHYMLKKSFDTAKYDLTEPEEKILNLKSLTSRSMWVEGVDRVVNKMTISYKKREVPINEALSLASSASNRAERLELHKRILEKLEFAGDFAESEMNAIVTDKKISDELRGFAHPYSATVLGYQNEEKPILTLVDTVTKAFPISHRFY